MTDVCYLVRDAVAGAAPQLPAGVDPDAPYVLATIHRADNTDDPARLAAVVKALGSVPVPVVLLAHPRLRARAAEFGLDLDGGSVRAVDPLPYPALVRAALGAAGVVTDSGGLQKEAFLLGVPCTTVRTETEWTETLLDGWNVLAHDLVGLDQLAARPAPRSARAHPYGDGHAATRVAETLLTTQPPP
jgi:UDP-N-acetylglucosamine 2-epimerase (non-hydrolysing)